MPLTRDPEELEIKNLLAHLDFTGKRVLEIGVGEGRLIERTAPHAAAYFGIDVDDERLAEARELARENPAADVPLALADALSLPFPAEEFDIGLLGWSL